MDTLKLVCLTIIQFIRQTVLLPRTVALALRHKRQQVVFDEHELDRLDRLRNPSKYQGK
jgi:hypothetical protein